MIRKIKDKIKFILWRFGLRTTIPASVINAIPIQENNEELIDIKQIKNLFFSAQLQKQPVVLLRKSVYNKIKQAQKELPADYFFKIYSAFRPLEEQMQLWNKYYQITKSENPNSSEQEIIRKTKAVCADPRLNFGGHQTGGAIDISLCDSNGIDYDMGTAYGETNNKTFTKSKNLTTQQKNNRKILQTALENNGLKNYPAEWWHFCYGDKMWAAYSRHKNCFYGMIKSYKK